MSQRDMTKAFGDADLSFHEYDGMVMSSVFPAKNLDRIKETVLDDEDIMVATYAKCGTTWMQQIVYMLQNDGDDKKAENVPTMMRWSFIEAEFPGFHNEYDNWAAAKPPRLIKTHLSAQFFQKTLSNSKAKIIIVLRNPKDALVSYFNFYKMNKVFKFDGSWDDFFQLYKDKKLVHGDIFDVQLSWWNFRNDPRVEVFTFEDMLKSPEEEIRRVMKHMGKSLPDDIVQKIVHETSFKSMKNNPLTNLSQAPLLRQEISAFMRKGKVGDWKNYFSAEQAAYVDKRSAEVFEANGLRMEDE